MNRLNTRCCAAVVSIFINLFTVPFAQAGEFEASFRKSVNAFLDTLDQEQLKLVLLPVSDTKNRWQMQYTGGKRPGIEISKLSAARSHGKGTAYGRF